MTTLVAYLLLAVLFSALVGESIQRHRWFTPLFCVVAGLAWPALVVAFIRAKVGNDG